jgi:hypothetical protein
MKTREFVKYKKSDLMIEKNPDPKDIYVHCKMKTLKGMKEIDLHGYLFGLLEGIKYRIENKYHGFIIVTGDVGEGKSTLVEEISAMAQAMNNRELTFDNIVWTSISFIEKTSRKDNFEETVWWDEAIEGGTGKAVGMTSKGNDLKVALVTKRTKRHLYILLIDEIQEYHHKLIRMANAWIHVKSFGIKRGYFDCYVKKHKISFIYHYLKKNQTNIFPKNVKPDGRGKFRNYNGFWLDPDIYLDKKLDETSQKEEEMSPKYKALLKENNIWIKMCKAIYHQYSDVMGGMDKDLSIPSSTFKRWKKKMLESTDQSS